MAASEYGGYAGSNRVMPDGSLRDLTPSDERKAMFREAMGLPAPDDEPQADPYKGTDHTGPIEFGG